MVVVVVVVVVVDIGVSWYADNGSEDGDSV